MEFRKEFTFNSSMDQGEIYALVNRTYADMRRELRSRGVKPIDNAINFGCSPDFLHNRMNACIDVIGVRVPRILQRDKLIIKRNLRKDPIRYQAKIIYVK